MKTIVLPVDFSALSKHALNYTIGLAEQIGAGIMPVHSYAIPNTSATFSGSLTEMLAKNAQESMDDFLKNIPAHIPCQSKVTAFPLKEELQHLSRDKSNIWVVMATHGVQDWLDHQLGTNASHIINALHVPVFLIPEKSEFSFPIHNVLFATDGLALSESVKKEWSTIKNELDADAQAVQVVNEPQEAGFGRFEELDLVKVFHKNLSGGLATAAHLVQPQLTVAVHHKRSLLQGLFHSSATKSLALQHDSPLVVLHE